MSLVDDAFASFATFSWRRQSLNEFREKSVAQAYAEGVVAGKKTGISAAPPRQNVRAVNSRDGDFRNPGAWGFVPPIGSGNDPPAVLFLPPALYISQIFSPDPDFFARPGTLFFGPPRKRLRALDSNFGAFP